MRPLLLRAWRLVQDGLQRIGRTARRLLDFSPRAKASVGSFALSVPIEGARALVEHRLKSQQVVLAIDLPPDLPHVNGDPHDIQQVESTPLAPAD